MNSRNTGGGRVSQREFAMRSLIASSITIGLALLLVFLWYATYVLLLLVAAALFAVLLSASIDLVRHWTSLSRPLALGVVLAALATVAAAFFAFAAPVLAQQGDELSQKLPESWATVEKQLHQSKWTRWLAAEMRSKESLKPEKSEMFRRAGGAISTITSAVVGSLIVLIVGTYFAYEPDLYCRGVLRLVPVRHRERASVVMGAVGYTLRWWLIGQLCVMTFVGVLTTIALWLLGIPMAILLGVIAFFLDFVPNIGPFIAAAPAVILSLVDSPQKAMYVALAYLAIQQIEGFVISPLVMQRTVSLPPVLTILAQVFMGLVAGGLGVLLAAPLTAVVLVLIKMLYVEEVLNDNIDTPADDLRAKDVPDLP